ncbi:enoyl-CoA hydratase/isomerase family protein [Nocardia sp. NPDC050712]|uniref:enoyl-CoA hydratase/isomerase family protein n=1 Tax=Nocardia sp. NPDC050712 TaxID=3155518 RepID=UPI003408015B
MPSIRVQYPTRAIATVTLDRPESLNAIDAGMAEQMGAAFTELASNEQLSVVIVTGAGRGFCSGADLSSAGGLTDHSGSQIMAQAAAALLPLARMPQLTVAAVDGPAIGAGWGLAMACDLRIAGPRAKFAATFVRMALGPDFGLSYTLPRAIGREHALELLATGRTINADTASRLGMICAIAPDPLIAALELATTIAEVPTRAIRSLKRTLASSSKADLDVVIRDIEAHAQTELLDHPDFRTDATAWMTRHHPG